jgi:hypothetical protein
VNLCSDVTRIVGSAGTLVGFCCVCDDVVYRVALVHNLAF